MPPPRRHSSDPRNAAEQSGGAGVLLWLLALALMVGVALWIAPAEQKPVIETTPEPQDTRTRTTCRQWQVSVAASGIADYLDAGSAEARERTVAEFLVRAEATAMVRDAEQETFLAIVASIEWTRMLGAAESRSDRIERFGALSEAMQVVDSTCNPTA